MTPLKRLGARGSLYAVVVGFTVFSALPFYVMLISMFKQNSDITNPSTNPFWFNAQPTLKHLQFLLGETQYLTWFMNTTFVGILVVAITLVLVVPAAYALARMTGRWGENLGIGIFLTYLVPPTLLFIPFAKVIATLGLQNSLWSLVLIYPSFTVPFCMWLLMGFFKGIPKDIEEQAMIDGYSRFGAFVRTVLPLSVPGILTVVVFAFSLTFHEFIYALVFVQDSAQKMISVGVPTELIRGDVYQWQALLGGALLAGLPIAVLYNLFIDRFVAGLVGLAKGS
ncbi:MAG: carbohydrate ABC transporter permease [Candidatus Bipolaricaulia bacterium]